jgi:N-methylhydantoinase B
MSLQRGQARLLEMISSYGLETLSRAAAALQDYTERMVRAEISRIPDGVYEFQDYLDSDGVGSKPVCISLVLTIRGDEAIADFSGSDRQADGPVNANYAIVTAATAYVFRCLLNEDVPFTAGLLRPIAIIAPEGTVVNARPPAAMAAGNVETSQRITDVLLGALAQALPDRIPAASSGTMNNVSFGGWDPIRNRTFTYYETIAGGMGGGPVHHGQDGVHTHMTNSWNTPIEAMEHDFPVRIRRYTIRGGSGGGGRHRGGDGIVREFEFLAPADVTLLTDRRSIGPWGLQGGPSGQPGKNVLAVGESSSDLPAKTRFEVDSGHLLRVETPGAGGWGVDSV